MNYSKGLGRAVLAVLLLAPLACQDAWLNNIAPLGGNVAGGRGVVEVVFVNETPYRAIFTFGAYDPQDQTSVPEYGQFGVDPSQDETLFNRGLDPDTVTPRETVFFNCGRVFSLGGEEMVSRIKSDETAPFNNAPVIDGALRTGVYFTSAPLDDPDANGVEDFDVRVDPVNSLVGVDYDCDSLLIYTFEMDPQQPGTVVVKLDAIVLTED